MPKGSVFHSSGERLPNLCPLLPPFPPWPRPCPRLLSSYSPTGGRKRLGPGPDPGCRQLLQIKAWPLEPNWHFLALCPWASYAAASCLSFSICEVEINTSRRWCGDEKLGIVHRKYPPFLLLKLRHHFKIRRFHRKKSRFLALLEKPKDLGRSIPAKHQLPFLWSQWFSARLDLRIESGST